MKYTEDTTLVITSQAISRTTIKDITKEMYYKVLKFVQDGDCGFALVEEYDNTRKWIFVATPEAAQLLTGGM